MASNVKRIRVSPESEIATALREAARDQQPVEFESGGETLRFVPETQRERLFAVLDRIRARNCDKDPDEVLADVTAVVESARQENYDRRQAAQSGR